MAGASESAEWDAELIRRSHEWLGTPEGLIPNHYQLLGISLFESDPTVIRNGFERQYQFVKQQGGKYLAVRERLLCKLAAAHVCLSNAAKKQSYDSQLRSAQAVAPAHVALVSAPPVVSSAPPAAEKSVPRTNVRARTVWAILLGTVALLLVALAIAGDLLLRNADSELAVSSGKKTLAPAGSDAGETGERLAPADRNGVPENLPHAGGRAAAHVPPADQPLVVPGALPWVGGQPQPAPPAGGGDDAADVQAKPANPAEPPMGGAADAPPAPAAMGERQDVRMGGRDGANADASDRTRQPVAPNQVPAGVGAKLPDDIAQQEPPVGGPPQQNQHRALEEFEQLLAACTSDREKLLICWMAVNDPREDPLVVARARELLKELKRVMEAHRLADDACKLLVSGKAVDAREKLKQANAIAPELLRSIFLLGLVEALEFRNTEEARRAFKAALARAPNHPCVLNNLALLELRLGHVRQAIKYLKAALAEAPRMGQALANLRRLTHFAKQRKLTLNRRDLEALEKYCEQFASQGVYYPAGWLFVDLSANGGEPSGLPLYDSSQAWADNVCLRCEGHRTVNCPRCANGRVLERRAVVPGADYMPTGAFADQRVNCEQCGGVGRVQCRQCAGRGTE